MSALNRGNKKFSRQLPQKDSINLKGTLRSQIINLLLLGNLNGTVD